MAKAQLEVAVLVLAPQPRLQALLFLAAFGGPEGALGALGGGACGGKVYAGAAIGAQIGGIRQAVGVAAAYAANIEKPRIAPRNN